MKPIPLLHIDAASAPGPDEGALNKRVMSYILMS